MSEAMVRVKYVGYKPDGMPVTYPIGCKNRSGFTKIVRANPFLDCTKEESEFLLRDKNNWALASAAEKKLDFENEETELVKPKAARASQVKVQAAAKRGRGRPKQPVNLEEIKPAEEAPAPAPLALKSKGKGKSAKG